MTQTDFIKALEQEEHEFLFRREDEVPALDVDLLDAARSATAPGSCHAGVRAPRYVENQADLAAHPELFRCRCGMLLDTPEWERS
jgi:hypothetical protein